jgi:hypothetical protein
MFAGKQVHIKALSAAIHYPYAVMQDYESVWVEAVVLGGTLIGGRASAEAVPVGRPARGTGGEERHHA